jgi:chaperonin GroEL
VAVARPSSSQPPEVLDRAALIARRTIRLSDPFADMGAMLIRHLVWRVFDQTGDGTATAGVLAEALLRGATRYVLAGANPVAIRRGLERGLPLAVAALRAQARPIELPSDLARLVAGGLHDDQLAATIGQIVDAVGPDGAIMVEDAAGATTGYDYVDGMRWDQGGYVSTFLLKAGEHVGRVLEPCIFLTDFELDSAEQLLPAVEACLAAGSRSLLVVAAEVRDSAIGLMVVNRERGVLDDVLAVRAPSYGSNRTAILEDLAAATGARCVLKDRHDRLADVTPAHLGRARQAWATQSTFAILGGRGPLEAVRARMAEARAELGELPPGDPDRARIAERIGKLAGTAAAIRVGAPTELQQGELKVRVETAVKTARAAVRSGVVPGGGAALLAASVPLAALQQQLPRDEALGVRLLTDALAEPMAAIVGNAGLEAAPILAAARLRGAPWLFDVLDQAWRDAWTAGILDPLDVITTALEAATSSAATALCAEVLIHRQDAPVAFQP